MRSRLTVLSLALAAHSVMAQAPADVVREQPPFSVISAFWPNLHHVLWAEAWRRRPPTEESAAGPMPEPLSAALTSEERAAWEAAVAYYDAEIADLHPLFEMSSIRKAMIAAAADGLPAEALAKAGLDPPHHQVLAAAAPVYRKYWWPAHDAANRAWVVDPMAKVAALTPAVPERLAALFGAPWLTGRVRVDVVRVANREGAFTSIDPPPAHITISSSAPNNRDWTTAEILFHESAHAMVFPLIDAFAVELRSQRKTSRDLWHVALFYMTGETVRQTLAARGIAYEPYMYKTGLFNRAWPHLRTPVETHWKPFVDGQVSREVAIRNVVAAARGIDMPVGAYFTDIILRWGRVDLGAILFLGVWSALAATGTPHARSVLVAVGLTVMLGLLVRLFSHAGINVLVHALAAAGGLLAARTLAIGIATWPRAVRILLSVIASAIGYAAGRGVALLFI
jgi:hypothetical protein